MQLFSLLELSHVAIAWWSWVSIPWIVATQRRTGGANTSANWIPHGRQRWIQLKTNKLRRKSMSTSWSTFWSTSWSTSFLFSRHFPFRIPLIPGSLATAGSSTLCHPAGPEAPQEQQVVRHVRWPCDPMDPMARLCRAWMCNRYLRIFATRYGKWWEMHLLIWKYSAKALQVYRILSPTLTQKCYISLTTNALSQ